MATLTTWTLSKRNNSTKTPSGAGNQIDVTLKGGCDILAPVFVLNFSGIPSFNYCLFQARYYFVSDIKSVREDLWEVSCNIDVLGTYKANIQASSPYVLYYDHVNTEISDRRLSLKTTKTLQTENGVFDTLGNGTGTNYAVAINVVGETNVDTYIVDQSTARTLLNEYDNWFENSGDYDPGTGSREGSGFIDFASYVISTTADAVMAFLEETLAFWKQWFASGKIADNIISAYTLPLPVSAFSGTNADIWLGKYNTGITGLRIDDRIFSDGCSVTIPWQASDWRRNAPYHELYLYIPYIGLISLPVSDLIGDTTINVSVSIDITCGDAVFTVYTGTNRYIGQYTTNMAATFAIGSSNVPVSQTMNSIVAAATAGITAIATGGTSAAIGAITAGGISLANDVSGAPTCIGSNMGGAVLGVTDKVVCYSVFHDTTVTPSSVSAEKGTPYNGVLSLSAITGYVQTLGASVAGALTDTEREQINQLMDGGFFIE